MAIILIVGALIYYFKFFNLQSKTLPPASQKKKEIVYAKKLLNSYPATDADKNLQNGPYNCPLPASFCKNKNAYKESSFSAQIAKDTKILASFDGTAEGLKSFHPLPDKTNEEFQLVLLTSNKLGLQAMYYFKGTATPKKEVKQGEVIATSSGQPINFMDNKSFVFSLIKNQKEGGKLVTLSPADFK